MWVPPGSHFGCDTCLRNCANLYRNNAVGFFQSRTQTLVRSQLRMNYITATLRTYLVLYPDPRTFTAADGLHHRYAPYLSSLIPRPSYVHSCGWITAVDGLHHRYAPYLCTEHSGDVIHPQLRTYEGLGTRLGFFLIDCVMIMHSVLRECYLLNDIHAICIPTHRVQ